MSDRCIPADFLRQFVEQAFVRIGYSIDQAIDAANVLMWASLRGIDTHGVRNLKSFYIDRTLDGQLNPEAQCRIEHETPNTARLDGGSGLGLVCACQAMRLAIEKARTANVGIVCVRNTHHLGPAGYYAELAVKHGMLGACLTGHFGKDRSKGVAPPGTTMPLFSTNPVSFAAPCGHHAPFVLDMSTSVATINRIEMHAEERLPIPRGWACDVQGRSTTDPTVASIVLPLGGTPELGGCKGAGLAMMVSILSGVLSGAWASVESAQNDSTQTLSQPNQYNQPTMGHFFAAVRIDAFQPLDSFRAAMDAMIDVLKAVPTTDPSQQVQYAGEREFETAKRRKNDGIPIGARTVKDIQALSELLGLTMKAP